MCCTILSAFSIKYRLSTFSLVPSRITIKHKFIMKCPPTYVINLKRNPERKLFIQRQLDAFNLNYQLVDAIDKYDLESPKYRFQTAQSLGMDESNLEYKYAQITQSSKGHKGYNSEGLGRLACLLCPQC